MPRRVAASTAAPVKAAPVEAAPVKAARVKAGPVKAAPVKPTAVKVAPVKAEPVKAVPVKAAPVRAGVGAKSTVRARRGATPRRVGIMGGTFDPIHHGHLVAASEVAGRFMLDEVVFVPTGQPWQKDDSDVSAAEDRYLMTVIATASNPRFQVSRVDVDREGPTYTVDTLRELREAYGPKVELFFITGADALNKILSWKDSEQLFELAHLVGVTRPGFRLSARHLPAESVSLVQVPAMAISSTDCRDRVAAGLPVWYLVPDGVVQYIAKRGLYRSV
jgi:nicotinate-nucleotide adenylyltransferase